MNRRPEVPPAPVSFYDDRLLVISALLVAAYLGAALAPGNALQLVLGVFVLLWAPGYGLGAILLGGRGGSLSPAIHLPIVVGLSVLFNGLVALLFLLGGYGLNAIVLGSIAFVPAGLGAAVRSRGGGHGSLRAVALRLTSSLRFPGFSPTQRRTAQVLLVGCLLTFGVIAYEATVVPAGNAQLSLAATGPDGTTNTLPTSGQVGQPLTIQVTIISATSYASAVLSVSSAVVGVNSTGNSSVPWSLPLPLGPGVSSSEVLAISAGSTVILPISFSFARAGTYVVTIAFASPGGADRVSVVVGEVIS